MGNAVSFQATIKRIRERRGARQFVKFAIVGLSSTIIDYGLHWLLFIVIDGSLNDAIRNSVYSVVPALRDSRIDPAFVVIKGITFVTATLNGFHWNRHWSFKAADKDLAHRQLVRFYTVYTIGLLINTTVAGLLDARGAVYLLALVIATVVTTAWTFPMTKFWTFRRRK